MRHRIFTLCDREKSGCQFTMYTSDAQQINIKNNHSEFVSNSPVYILPDIIWIVFCICESYRKSKEGDFFETQCRFIRTLLNVLIN